MVFKCIYPGFIETLAGVELFLTFDLLFSDPQDEESLTSDPEELEVEDELQAATQHLTQDFLCHVIQEEEGRGKKPEDSVGEKEVGPDNEGEGPPRQTAPLAVILGKLPRAASLGLQETFHPFSKLETDTQPDGKNRNTSVTSS